ncbi:amino acid adenylation domain-containing protein [Pseudomonas sp. Z1-12]|uniref:amino acid adenylation domain-containing protein n=1 Tax=Pseudomonas sp. Z1-12 TaxID=2817408 RepID=UPI003DA99F94
MSVIELLATLKEKDVQLSVKGDQLVVRGRKQSLSEPAVLALLREHKAALIALIQAGEYEGGKAGEVDTPASVIPVGCVQITPDMLPLVTLDQPAIDRIVATVPGGAANVQDIYPLAPLQEGILYHHLIATEGDPYVLQAHFSITRRERLRDFIDALQSVIDRHDILRTAIIREGLEESVQVVWREARLGVKDISADLAEGDVLAQLQARFDPRHYRLDVSQAPLLLLVVAQDTANQRWVAMLLFHHMALDHEALSVVQNEMQAYLMGQAGQLRPAVPYRHYVARTRQAGQRQSDEAFFSKMLGDVDEPTLPFGHQDVLGDGIAIEEGHQALTPDLSRRLRAQARQLGVSAASIVHLAWAQVLGCVSGREDVVFGTVMLGRMQAGESMSRALGMFINTLPLRVGVGAQSVRDGVKDTHAWLSALLSHEYASLALAQRCSGVVAPAPLFSALLNYRHSAGAAQALPPEASLAWEGIESLGAQERTNFPLSLSVDDLGDDFSLSVLAVPQIGAQRVCVYMDIALEQLVAALETSPRSPLNSLSILPPAERSQSLETWNMTDAAYALDALIHRRFEAQASEQPEAVALEHADQTLTYGELNARANQVSRRLLALGVRPNDRVAICVERSLEMIVGLLGILKSGAGYVPIDPAYPAERIAYLLQDSAPVAVLAQTRTHPLLGDVSLPVVDLDGDDWQGESVSNPQVQGLDAQHLAYVIYTSGSTGLPKGVMVEHRNLNNLVDWHCHAFAVGRGSRTSSVAGFGFDAAAWEVWPALCAGATLLLPPAHAGSEDVDALLDWWQAQALDVCFLPTPIAEYALGRNLSHDRLRKLLIGGDRLRKLPADLPFDVINNYGPTETTVVATSGRIDASQQVLHIGRPVANTRVYLLDAQLRPVPVGVAGELYIGGAGVARGYLNRPELTAERFVKDPFSLVQNARMYRTGDLGRYLPDGNIEYLGRNDGQLKIRGLRIELGEIESRLGACAGVREAVVIALGEAADDQRLVAYYTVHDAADQSLAPEGLQAQLQVHLPKHMVPSAYVRLDRLPLTPNGKLDRKALPAPDHHALITRGYEAPRSETEITLAHIWQGLLKVERVGRHDHFFELGGHSLLAVNLIEQMRQVGLSADVRVLFGQPTLAALAAAVGSGNEVLVPANGITPGCERITPQMLPLATLSQDAIDRIVASVPGGASNIQDIYALAPLQEGILYHHMSTPQGDPYGLQALFAFQSEARLDAFAQALQSVIDRHDILRTSVLWEGLEQPVQVVWRKAVLSIEQIAFNAGDGDAVAQLHARFDARYHRLDIRQAPLMCLRFAHDPANQRWVAILLFHHIALDHTALEVVQQEMQAFLLGQADALPDAMPYRNYVAQARLGVSQAEHEAFFREMLGDVDEPTLPLGLQQMQGDGRGVEEARLQVDAGLSRRLRAQARQLGVSAASLHHLAWAQVLGRLSGRDNVVFGSVLMGRMQGGEGADRALGMFINTLPLRIDLDEPDVRVGVKATHARLSALLGHEHASLALAQRCSGVVAPLPLFSALLNYRHSAAGVASAEATAAWQGMENLSGEERTNYPLTLSVDDLGEGFSLDAQVLQGMGATRICGYMHTALEHLVLALEHASRTPLNRLEILPEAEREQLLVDFNATRRPYPQDRTVHGVFEAQVLARPQAIAAVHASQRLTYGELNAKANRLARHLIDRGVQPGDCVAIALERSIELLVSQLAILKCAAVYVPLDVSAPLERQQFMVQDSGAQVVLTLSTAVAPDSSQRVDLDTAVVNEVADNLDLAQSSESVAYLMFTSGSTGTPKGVLVPHRAVNRLVINNGYADFNEHDRVAFASNPAFDASTLDVWAPLLNGGCVVVVEQDVLLTQERFRALLLEQSVSVLWMTAGLFHQYASGLMDVFGQLRYLIVGGDVLDPAVIARVLSEGAPAHLLNGYGPTEATTFTTTHEIKAVGEGGIPIGRPVGNSRVYILDTHRQPVPAGVAGELYIGGDGVAKGYLNRPELTAEKFVTDPFNAEPDAVLYRTGDLARWRADGVVEYLGRNDDQVKIRGFRIELGEIEVRLGQCAGVKDAVVLARQDETGPKRLVGYVIPEGGITLSAQALRAELVAALADYMVPSAFVVLPSFPLTANGKLDRRALPEPDADAYASREYAAPQGEVEQTLAQLWAELLKVERVGRHDHFFELGGHSLLAMSLIERMRQVDLSVDVRVLFSQPTLRALAAAVGGYREVVVPANAIVEGCQRITPDLLPLAVLSQEAIDRIVASVPGGVGNVQDIYPLAPLQEGVLYHHLTAEKGDPYVLQTVFGFERRARLDEFIQALQQVIDRHDILRTSIVWEGLEDPMQVVWRRAQLMIDEQVPEPNGADVITQLYERFDARHYRLDVRQAPLLRLAIAEDAANQRWIAMLLFHHMVLDHTGLEVLDREMQAHMLGKAHQLGAAVPYRNYVAQARLGVSQQEHEAFFREMLGDIDEPTLPFGLQNVQGDGNGVEEVRLVVAAGLCRRLREQARQLGVSAASVMHLAWARVLGHVSARDDVVFGTVLLGRLQGGEGADRALGMFINTLPLRVSLGEQGVVEGVRSTHKRLTGLLGHEHASLALAQRCSGVVAPTPLFSSMLNYRHCGLEATAQTVSAWEGIETLGGEERTNYPLALSVDDEGEGFSLVVQALVGTGARRIGEYVQATLEGLVTALEQAPHTPLHALTSLPAAERRHLLETFNATAVDYPQGLTLHGLFETRVAACPDAVAVVSGEAQLSYAQLNERANQIAHRLLELGIRPDDRVAICADRSLDMVAGLLGILKAGAAYVPLDPDYPRERLAYMLENSAPMVVLTQRALRASLPATQARTLLLDEADGFSTQPTDNPQVEGLHAHHLAYVIYTSGSTGLPKGVMNEHGGVVNRLLWMQDEYGLSAADAVLQKTPFSFDVSVWEFFWPLFSGARLVMARPGGHRDPAYLREVIQAQGITTLHFVPSMLDVFLAHGEAGQCEGLVRVMCSGEALPGHLVRRFKAQLPHVGLYNLYGPTEAAVDVTAWDCTGADTPDSTPIGKPIANTRIYLLDDHQQPAPLGVAGEIYIGGVQVARGYLNRPELTVERFLRDPFSTATNARMYRTGDLGRYLPDGNIDYLGRNDDQVKIRGFRIELGEIEAKLAQHEAVKEAVVLAREDAPGEKRLVAYFTTHSVNEMADIEALRTHLLGQLPEYMVPTAYVRLEALPLTPNGKLDRKELPAPDHSAVIAREYEAPQGEVEASIARIWEDLLKLEQVGRHDNFFELGGHSLLAVKMIERMRQVDLSVDVRVLFGQPTLAALAAAVGGYREVVVPANGIPAGCTRITPDMLPLADLTQEEIERIVAAVPGGVSNVQDIYALAPLQEGILYHHLTAAEGDPYLQQVIFGFDSFTHLEDFAHALQAVITRHDILRTGVLWEGLSEPMQVVWRDAPLSFESVGLDPAQGDIATQLHQRFDPRFYRLDIRQAPMMRIVYAQDPANQRWVGILLFHHLVDDVTSLAVLSVEIEAHMLGQAQRLSASVPYRNYVAQARLGVSREEHETFFCDMLGDIDEPTLPFELQDVQGDGSGLEEVRQDVGADLSRRLRAQARQLGVSAASLYHLVWAQVLGKVSGKDDVVFGTVLVGRMQGGEGADRALGMFINTLPLRVGLGAQGVRAGVKATHARLTALLGHEHASLALAQRCSGVQAPTPLFSALLNYRHTATTVSSETLSAWNGIQVLGGEERTNYPLMLSVDDQGEAFSFTVMTPARIGAQRLCGYVRHTLENLVHMLEQQPDRPLQQLSILPASEREQLLVTFNATEADYPRQQTIHGLFEEQVQRTSEAVAVICGEQSLSYGDLNERANRLAHYLRKQGVQPDSRVAICVERGIDMVVGLLAILKAGGGYVPLDPAYPLDRIAYMLEDSAPAAVLAQAATVGLLAEASMPVINLDSGLWQDESVLNPEVAELTSSHLAYVIYTSGSTGLPKGVMIEHHNTVNFLTWAHRSFDAQTLSKTLFSTSLNFDLAVYECFAPLTSGGSIDVVTNVLELQQGEHDITLINTVPSALKALLESGGLGEGVDTVNVAGEALKRSLVEALFEQTQVKRLCNLYGPSETTTYSSWVSMAREDGFVAHIGKPVANTQFYLLDEHKQPVPLGVPGEIYIGGAGVARGYLNRDDLTAERFLKDPFSKASNSRMYKTGDLGRYLPDGNIEYLGRNDDQVKIRGFRIELGEIEAKLAQSPNIKETVVLAREDEPGDKRLVAYFTQHSPDESADIEALRTHLQAQLPAYMVPAAYVCLDALPLTPNGKLDRKALPAPDSNAYVTRLYEAPVGDREIKLAALWAELLRVERVGRHDHFFELGGHSLLAVTLIERMRKDGMEADIRVLFGQPTLALVAAAVGKVQHINVPMTKIPALTRKRSI